MSQKELISTSVPSSELTLTRRRVLQMIAATGAASAISAYPFIASATPSPSGKSYGPDPDLFKGDVTWGKTLNKEQLGMLEILGDIIIPADDHSPKASDLNIADFVNEWVSAPYPDQQKDRIVIVEGLIWLDQQSLKHVGTGFIASSEKTRATLFDDLAKSVETGKADEKQSLFFELIVYLFVGGFYTTEEGMKDIGYVGNVPLQKFEGPPAEIRERLGL